MPPCILFAVNARDPAGPKRVRDPARQPNESRVPKPLGQGASEDAHMKVFSQGGERPLALNENSCPEEFSSSVGCPQYLCMMQGLCAC